jgi:hypothetical protein
VRVERWEADGRVGFALTGLGRGYHGAARDLGFGEERGAFVRWFPPGSTAVDEAHAGFADAIAAMLRQKAGEEPVPWEQALRAIVDATAGTAIDWWLAGSVALAVHGAEVAPHDLDLATDRRGVERLGEALRSDLVEPVTPVDD